jgi:hypothetical protein
MDTENVNVFDFKASTLELLKKRQKSEMKKRPEKVDIMPCQ